MLLLRFLINVFALLLTAYLVPGIEVRSLYTAIIVALILGILNLIIRPVLIILTLPITLLTLGLFALVINGLIFWFIASFVEGFEVANLWWAMLGALVMSIISGLTNKLVKRTSGQK